MGFLRIGTLSHSVQFGAQLCGPRHWGHVAEMCGMIHGERLSMMWYADEVLQEPVREHSGYSSQLTGAHVKDSLVPGYVLFFDPNFSVRACFFFF